MGQSEGRFIFDDFAVGACGFQQIAKSTEIGCSKTCRITICPCQLSDIKHTKQSAVMDKFHPT